MEYIPPKGRQYRLCVFLELKLIQSPLQFQCKCAAEFWLFFTNFISQTCITILKGKYFNKQFEDVRYLKDPMKIFSNVYFICDCCSFQCQMLIITRLHFLVFFNFLCEHTALGFHFFQITSIIRLASSTAILIYSSYMKSLAILVSCTDNSLVDQFQDILQYIHLFYQYCFWRENKNNYSKLNALD